MWFSRRTLVIMHWTAPGAEPLLKSAGAHMWIIHVRLTLINRNDMLRTGRALFLKYTTETGVKCVQNRLFFIMFLYFNFNGQKNAKKLHLKTAC